MRSWALSLCLLSLACGRQETQNLEGVDSGATILPDASCSGCGGDADIAHDDATETASNPDAIGTDYSDANAIIIDDLGAVVSPDSGVPPDDSGIPDPPDTGRPNRDASVVITNDGAVPDSGLCMVDRDCGRGGGITVFCEPTSGQCVECFEDMQCRRGQTCDLVNGNVCVTSCFAGGRCPPGQTCDPASNACYDCLDNTGCQNGEVCDLPTRECVECSTSANCTRVGESICDTATHECVGCASDNDCSFGVCDTSIAACVTSSTGRGLCEPCDDDAQCGGAGDLCIGTLSGAGFIDRTCALDCSSMTCPAGFDCIDVRQNSAQVCRPRYPMQNPTCTAYNHVGTACPFSATETDPGCGIENRQDALCILAPGGMSGVCTIGCAMTSDCPIGFTCTGAMPGGTGVCL